MSLTNIYIKFGCWRRTAILTVDRPRSASFTWLKSATFNALIFNDGIFFFSSNSFNPKYLNQIYVILDEGEPYSVLHLWYFSKQNQSFKTIPHAVYELPVIDLLSNSNSYFSFRTTSKFHWNKNIMHLHETKVNNRKPSLTLDPFLSVSLLTSHPWIHHMRVSSRCLSC